jgi:hypothetical protein
MTPARWWRRLAGGLIAFGVLEVVLVVLDTEPDAVRLALLVAICVAVLGLMLDALGDSDPLWEVPVEQVSARATGDSRLSRYANLLEAHLSARTLDTSLQDRLGQLADQILRQRHNLTRDDPRADELLGPELVAVLNGPARRLDSAAIDRCLTRIEEL